MHSLLDKKHLKAALNERLRTILIWFKRKTGKLKITAASPWMKMEKRRERLAGRCRKREWSLTKQGEIPVGVLPHI